MRKVVDLSLEGIEYPERMQEKNQPTHTLTTKNNKQLNRFLAYYYCFLFCFYNRLFKIEFCLKDKLHNFEV